MSEDMETDESNFAEQCIEDMGEHAEETTVCDSCGLIFSAEEYPAGFDCTECDIGELIANN